MANRTKIIVGLLLILILGTACSFLSLRLPKVVHHEQPAEYAVDISRFSEAGCSQNDYGQLECSSDSVFVSDFNCEPLGVPPDLFGALAPDYPVAVCTVWPSPEDDLFALEEQGYVYDDGCMMPVYVRYVIYRDGQFELVSTIEDMQQVYAPLESADEALAYAMAATGMSAYYDIEPERGMRYHVRELEDTYVEVVEDGYIVHLFSYQFCGCGPHSTYAVSVQVGKDGSVSRGDSVRLYEDPADDKLCVD